MKKVIYFIFLINVISGAALGQGNVIIISSKAEAVTIYLNGAEIHSTMDIAVRKGRNKLIIKDLSSSLDESSLQISADNTIELLSINSQLTNSPLSAVSPESKILLDSITSLRRKLTSINNQIEAYYTEKSTLSHNENIGGSQTGTSLLELSKAADFFHERALKINNALTRLRDKSETISSRLDSLKSDFEKAKEGINTQRREVTILFDALHAQHTAFSIRYLVSDAAWSATYDIIAKDINEPVTLKYKALVYNNTGVPWTNIKITLSTADPSLSASRPYLTPWTLNYSTLGNEGKLENRSMGKSDTTRATDIVNVTDLNTLFPITKPYSIPADGELFTLDISSSLLNASFEYLAIPRVDLSAFLLAKITGWEKLNLIDGVATVYFGNTYIGQSAINTRLFSDTLELSLGRDNQILVTRAKVEDLGNSKFIGTKRTESFKYELQIKNNRKVPINIRIQDQIPVSQETDIVVEVEEISGASLEKLYGKLQWIKTISSGDILKCPVAFSVKYPKNRKVSIRQQRIISTPRYRH